MKHLPRVDSSFLNTQVLNRSDQVVKASESAEEEEDIAGERGEGGEEWNSDYLEKREERCSVFCKLGVSVPDQSQESFSHSVCLTDWLTAQHLHNPDIDLFSAFFLGINF